MSHRRPVRAGTRAWVLAAFVPFLFCYVLHGAWSGIVRTWHEAREMWRDG